MVLNILFKIFASNWPVWNRFINAAFTVENFEKNPHLLYYSEDDPMNQASAMENMRHNWTDLNIDYQVQNWKKSAHAAHLVKHEEEYLKAFNDFVKKIQNKN